MQQSSQGTGNFGGNQNSNPFGDQTWNASSNQNSYTASFQQPNLVSQDSGAKEFEDLFSLGTSMKDGNLEKMKKDRMQSFTYNPLPNQGGIQNVPPSQSAAPVQAKPADIMSGFES